MTSGLPSVLDAIFGKQNLDEIPLEDIYAVLRDFPSFNAAHFLLSQKLKSEDHPAYLEETKKTALYFNNPVWLQLLLEGPASYEVIADAGFTVYREPETVAVPSEAWVDNMPAPEEEPGASHPSETINEAYSFPETTLNEEYEQERESVSDVRSDLMETETAQDLSVAEVTEPGDNPPSPAINDTYTEPARMINETYAEEEEAVPTLSRQFHADIPEEGIYTENEIYRAARQGEKPAETSSMESANIAEMPEEAGTGEPETVEQIVVQEIEIPEPEAAVETIPEFSAPADPFAEADKPEETTTAPEDFFGTPFMDEEIQPSAPAFHLAEEQPSEPAAAEPAEVSFPDAAFHSEAETEAPVAVVLTAETESFEPVAESNGSTAFDVKKAESIVFEPYHMVDYFASQGIRLELEEQPADQFGRQLKRFTEWLRVMKKLPLQQPISGKTDEREAERIRHFAAHSIEERDILTETMAEVLAKQGMYENAIALYQKLSLIYPPKSAYFASRIEQLKASLP